MNWFPEERIIWEPPELLTISEWAEKYRMLTEPAEEKGPLRLRRTPYLRPVLDAFLDPEIEEVVLCKSAQIAGTEGMLSVIGYYAHQEAAPIMVVLADEDTAKYISRERIQKMIQSSREMSALVDQDKFGIIEISLLNGAYIAMAWASSVAKLASRPIRVIIFDEVDKPGYYVQTREANPISLGIERTETFWNKKIGILSTPTDENGNICRRLEACDAVFDWHVPCPYCGQHQPMVWSMKYSWGFENGQYRDISGAMKSLGGVVWEGGRNATHEQVEAAGYRCGECGEVWSTVQKNMAVENGRPSPRAEIPSVLRRVGFHVSRLYSLLGKSGEIPKLVRDFISALKSPDPKDLQGFVNSTLAQPFKQVVAVKDESDLKSCLIQELPPMTVPNEAIALTCGIDVQKYGFWFTTWAWARDHTSWLIHYGHLATWEDVEHLLFQTEYGGMRIWRAGVDTGGGEKYGGISTTEEAYWWIRQHGVGRGCRVWGTKGASNAMQGIAQLGKPLDKAPSGRPIPGGLQLVMLDTHQIKDMLHHRFQQAKLGMPMGAYVHAGTDHVFFSHIMAEEKRRNRRGGEEWVKVKPDNHLLDCSVIAHALADPTWPGGGGVQNLRGRVGSASAIAAQQVQPSQQSRRSIKFRSQFMGVQ